MDDLLISLDRQNKLKQVLACILDIGATLLANGAEVMRVEDSVSRMCHAYGFKRADVFTVTSSIFLSATYADDNILSQNRRVTTRGTDLEKVARANELSRRICSRPLPLEELKTAVEELDNAPAYSERFRFLLYGGIAAVFTVFFGGTWADSLAAGLTALVLFFAQKLGGRLRMNSILLNTVCSGIAALTVLLLCRFGPGQNPDKIIIGNIMLLIPGLALTTSLRDMINGDTLSGLMGFCEALIKALAIAIGSALVLYGLGG